MPSWRGTKKGPTLQPQSFCSKSEPPVLEVSQAIFFATPLEWQPHFWPRMALAAARASVFMHQKQRLSLQCGAFWLKSGTLAGEVSQKKKLMTPLARERRFPQKRPQAATRSQIHVKV